MVDPLATLGTLVFAPALKKLVESYTEQQVKQHFTNSASIKTDFEPHLEATFDKCTKIKTVLHGTKPLNMLDIYADQSFEVNEQKVDQYDVIDRFKTGGTYVLTGTGGGGKSMFMRYLWISLFEDPRGKIPFFLELRSFVKTKHIDLEDFIYQSVLKTGSTISKENFTKSLKAGDFYLLFDGFDEVAHDNRQELQTHIISLRENNPNVALIVSSRPDQRFSNWNQFEIIKVLPLNESQVGDLVEKAPFDKEKKAIFLKNLGSLYETHGSFLSTPLLAYMMLIAYGDNQNLPDRMVDFYKHAFNALFERHDLMKNGYKRKLYCNLGRIEFKKLISLISLASYRQEKYEFTQEELETLIDKAQKPLSLNQTSENVIRDLTESLCFFKKEGLSYNFTHRSFQEYFAAYCLTWHHSKILAYVEKFSMRISDNVVLMLYQLDPQLFRKEIIVPIYEKNIDFFNHYDNSLKFIVNYFNIAIPVLFLNDTSEKQYYCNVHFSSIGTPLPINLSRQIKQLFSNYLEKIDPLIKKLDIKNNGIMFIVVKNNKLLFSTVDDKNKMASIIFDICANIVIPLKDILDSPIISIDTKVSDLFAEFEQTGVYKNLKKNFDRMYQFFKEEYELYIQEQTSVDDFDDF